MSDGFDDIAGTGFTFRTDHGGAFRDAAQGFAEAAAAADEGDAEGVFGDVVDGVGGGEDFGLVDVVYAEGFEDLWSERLARDWWWKVCIYVPGIRQSGQFGLLP